MPAEDVLNEPIFFNRQISVPLGSSSTGSANGSSASRPLTPHDQPLMLAAGVTKLAHLQVALLQQHPPTFTASLQSVLTTIPPPWRAIVTAAPTAPTWQQGLSASGSQLIQNTQTGQRHSLSSHAQLQQSHAQLATATSHVRVISWDPSRPWRGPTRQPTQTCCALLTRAAVGPQPLVNGGVGLGTAACPPADSKASESALAADSSPEAWHFDSRGVSLSPSPAALARLRPNLSSSLAGVGIQVDSFPTGQPIRQGSSQLRPA